MSEEKPVTPPGEESRELLDDLRNILVTEESRGVKEVIEILGALQSKIEDRRGLTALIAPVLAEALAEAARENPAELRRVLAPIVRSILADEAEEPSEPPAARAKLALLRPLRALAERAKGLLVRPQPETRKVVEEDISPVAAEVCDADFALLELFMLARPSLALLAHGSWQAAPLHAQAEEQLLPLLRRFIREKTPDQDLAEPLRAMIDRHHLLIQPGKHAYLVVLYEGTPTEGFRLDVRTSLAALHTQHKDALRRAYALPSYRAPLRLLLDRYRPEASRMGEKARHDPLSWPPPGTAPIATTPPRSPSESDRPAT